MKQLAKDMRQNIKGYEAQDTAEKLVVVRRGAIPDVEWWDRGLLKVGSPSMCRLGHTHTHTHTHRQSTRACGVGVCLQIGDNEDASYAVPLQAGKITSYIYNPVPLKPVTEAPPPAPMPLYLTEAEKKKMRRMRKLEKEKVKQEQIRFALISAPEPKVSLNNMQRVLGDNLVSNPSLAEAKVREQMAERKTRHEETNKARQLTKEQKGEKRRKKLLEDTSREVHVRVFRAGDLYDGQRRYKLDITAQQFSLTGCVVITGSCNVVVIEGGPKACKKFERLLLQRIQWTDKLARGDDEDDDGMEKNEEHEGGASKWNNCVLAWQGVLAKRKFKTFAFENCRSELMGRGFFEQRGLEHYWDSCKNYVEVTQA